MKKFSYSIKNIITAFFVGGLVLALVSYMCFVLFYSRVIYKNTIENMNRTIDLYVQNLNTELINAETWLRQFHINSSDLISLTTITDDISRSAVHQIRVQQTLQDTLDCMYGIDGLYYFFPKSNIYVSGIRYETIKENEYAKNLLRNVSPDEREYSNWYFVKQNDETFLFRIIPLGDAYCGAWCRLDSIILPFTQIDNPDALYIYLDGDGVPIQELDIDSSDYIIYKAAVPFSNCFLQGMTPKSNVYKIFKETTLFTFLIALLFLFIHTILIGIARKYLSQPLATLKETSSLIKSGGYHARFDLSDENCKEIFEMKEAINSLLSEITALQRNVYNERLSKKEYELMALKNQVAPHFLINCLSAISSLPPTEEGHAIVQEMSAALSNHLRYLLNSRLFVPLSEEIYYIKNYLRFTELRFPGFLHYDIDIDDECMDASIMPIMLLTSTENAIKYNMVMGEHLYIKIRCYIYEINDNKYIRIEHIDSGAGYDPEDLNSFNEIALGRNFESKTGNQIGIYNLVKRIILNYGDDCLIRFSNEPDMGARIDIALPYIPYKETD